MGCRNAYLVYLNMVTNICKVGCMNENDVGNLFFFLYKYEAAMLHFFISSPTLWQIVYKVVLRMKPGLPYESPSPLFTANSMLVLGLSLLCIGKFV